jgi:hypothetical protein
VSRDEIRLRVERRGGLHRLIDDVSGLLARDGVGEAIDHGGFRRRSQAERAARLLESEARYRLRTGRWPIAPSNEKVRVLPTVTMDDAMAAAELAPPTYRGGAVRVDAGQPVNSPGLPDSCRGRLWT